MERLTDGLEGAALRLIEETDRLGGAVAAIEQGFPQAEIEEAAYQASLGIETGDDTVVGVNRYADDAGPTSRPLSVDPALEGAQRDRVAAYRSERRQLSVDRALVGLVEAAGTETNLMYPMKESLVAGATLGEVSDALRRVFGVHRAR